MLRWRAQVRKSASPQAFFVAPQRKLRFSKAQLRSLRFKILDATFNRNFYVCIWYGETHLERYNSVVVVSLKTLFTFSQPAPEWSSPGGSGVPDTNWRLLMLSWRGPPELEGHIALAVTCFMQMAWERRWWRPGAGAADGPAVVATRPLKSIFNI